MCRPISGRAFVVLSLLSAVVALSVWPPWASPEDGVRAQESLLGVPDVQSRRFGEEDGSLHRGAIPAAPLAQEGAGGTTITMLDRSGALGSLQWRLRSKQTGETRMVDIGLGDGGAAHVPLSEQPEIAHGAYAASMVSTGDVRAAARTVWPNQAAVAYEAEMAAGELILPLFVVEQPHHSSVVVAQNPDATEGADAGVDLYVFDPTDGSVGLLFGAQLGPGETSSWDTAFDQVLFGAHNLSRNVAGGFIGTVHIEARRPVVVSAYGESIGAAGSSAYQARPKAAASTSQILPWVHASEGMDSLIAVAAAGEGDPTAVTLTFRPAVAGGTIAEPTTVAHTIVTRGAIFMDLGGLERGTVDTPSLSEDFVGSVLIEADKPVLAAALTTKRKDGAVDGLGAYNGLAPDELSTRYVVPRVRHTTGFRTTTLVVHNPGDAAAQVVASFRDAGDAPAGEIERTIAGGDVVEVALTDVDGFPRGLGSATVQSDRPIAVLVADQRDTSATYPLPPVDLGMGPDRGSSVSGSARLTQIGDDVEVVVRLNSQSSMSLIIQEGPCSDDDGRRAYSLNDVTGGRSTTLLKNVDLVALGDEPHAIRARRGRWRQACGNIPVVYDLDDADLSIGLALAARPPATPTPTPSPTPSATATPEATTTPAASPTATATTQSGIYLPIARRD